MNLPKINFIKMSDGHILTFKAALKRSLLLHGVILLLVLGNISFQALKPKTIVAKSPDPIKAVAISENDLKAEVSRLKKIDMDKKYQEQQDRERERERLAHEQEVQQQKLAELKKQQMEAQKALERENAKIKETQRLAEKLKQENLAKAKADKLKKEDALKAQAAKDKEKALNLAKEESKRKTAAAEAAAAAKKKALAEQEEAKRLALEQGQMREIEKYKLMVQQQIERAWSIPGARDSRVTILRVRVAPSGEVLTVQVTTSSGDPTFDRSAVAAVNKASPLQVPEDPALFASFREFNFTMRPDAIISGG